MTDPIAKLALWVAGHVEWMRHRQDVAEFLADVDAATRIVSGIARGPTEQQYLGPCGAKCCDLHNEHCEPPGDLCCADCTEAAHPEHSHGVRCAWLQSGVACDGDIYAARGSRIGRCRTCRAEVATSEREAWLDGEVRGHAFRASEIEDAYGVNANLIRQWATPARGLIQIHGHDTQGRALYLLKEVLDVAAGQAARRAEAQAKRARRMATREDGDAA